MEDTLYYGDNREILKQHIPHSSLEFRGQPSIAVVICPNCRAELQVVRDNFNKFTSERLK